MSVNKWQHKVVDVAAELFGTAKAEDIQAELDKWGAQGWQLVSVISAGLAAPVQLFLKREA